MKTKEIPLEPKDVPPGSIVGKYDGGGNLSFWHMVLTVHPLGVVITGFPPLPCEVYSDRSPIIIKNWERLAFHGWRIKRPGSDRWERCVKYVEEEKP